MLVGIHTDYQGSLDMNSRIFETILKFNEIPVIRMNSSDKEFWDTIPKLDLFIYMWGHYDVYRYRAQTILPIIENYYNIPCFPDQNTCWHYDDKIKQYFILKSKGFPVVSSWVHYDKSSAISWITNEAVFPFVFKLSEGASSSNVVLISSKKEALKVIDRIFTKGILPLKIPVKGNLTKNLSLSNSIKQQLKPFYNRYILKTEPNLNWKRHKNYFYVQKFLANNDYDTRVTTIGNRTSALRRFVRKNDFRASGSDNWSFDIDKIDIRMVKIAQEVSNAFKFQVMAYDFIYDDARNPIITEISYNHGGYRFPTGFINEGFEYINGSFWTQYLYLYDVLHIPGLKQPEIKAEGHYANVLKQTLSR
jgi:glutathione synthase/RimK-type ligase-like ATP-grasp enzyme